MTGNGNDTERLRMGSEFDDGFRTRLDQLFRWRRDVRRFRSDPLDPELVLRLLDAAAAAPSVGLSEPWRFVLVESPDARAAVAENFRRENEAALAARDGDAGRYAALKLAGLDRAPVQIAAFCDEGTEQGRGLGARTMPEARRYSVVCAVMQLWLAARAEGVGVGWISILDPASVVRGLGLPRRWRLVAYLCVGRPEEEHQDCELERAGWERRRRLDGKLIRI